MTGNAGSLKPQLEQTETMCMAVRDDEVEVRTPRS
jgi:hypothetical protein